MNWDVVSERHDEGCMVQNNLSSYEACMGLIGCSGGKEQELSRLQCPARKGGALEKSHGAQSDAGAVVRNQGLGIHKVNNKELQERQQDKHALKQHWRESTGELDSARQILWYPPHCLSWNH